MKNKILVILSTFLLVLGTKIDAMASRAAQSARSLQPALRSLGQARTYVTKAQPANIAKEQALTDEWLKIYRQGEKSAALKEAFTVKSTNPQAARMTPAEARAIAHEALENPSKLSNAQNILWDALKVAKAEIITSGGTPSSIAQEQSLINEWSKLYRESEKAATLKRAFEIRGANPQAARMTPAEARAISQEALENPSKLNKAENTLLDAIQVAKAEVITSGGTPSSIAKEQALTDEWRKVYRQSEKSEALKEAFKIKSINPQAARMTPAEARAISQEALENPSKLNKAENTLLDAIQVAKAEVITSGGTPASIEKTIPTPVIEKTTPVGKKIAPASESTSGYQYDKYRFPSRLATAAGIGAAGGLAASAYVRRDLSDDKSLGTSFEEEYPSPYDVD